MGKEKRSYTMPQKDSPELVQHMRECVLQCVEITLCSVHLQEQ